MLHACFSGLRTTLFSSTAQARPVLFTPLWIKKAFKDQVARTGFTRVPRLVVVDDAGGAIGMHIPELHGPGTVVIGLADIDRLIAHAFRAGYLRRLSPQDLVYEQPLFPKGDDSIRTEFAHRVIGHELGHARERLAGRRYGGIIEEATCDTYSGQLDELLNLRREPAELLFDLIGCNHGAFCTHPDSVNRVAAYRDGREIEIHAARRRRLAANGYSF